MHSIISVLCFSLLYVLFGLTAVNGTDRPIIGILAQEPWTNGGEVNRTYIAASYVKYVEMAGARVVPVLLNKTASYYDKLFASINGLLIPGGAASLNDSLYSKFGEVMYKKAVEANMKGDYFPIWGTCLGFELLSYFLANDTNIMEECVGVTNIALALNITKESRKSKLFGDLPVDVFQALINFPVTSNFHKYCLTTKKFESLKLSNSVTVLSTNYDSNGLQFISTMESKDFPFYSVQWHPEKNVFEWSLNETSIPHSADAVRVAQYFANFFISEARLSDHSFKSLADERECLIYNYQPEYVGDDGSNFEQIYYFDLENFYCNMSNAY